MSAGFEELAARLLVDLFEERARLRAVAGAARELLGEPRRGRFVTFADIDLDHALHELDQLEEERKRSEITRRNRADSTR